jgi:hypothetical protein
MSKDRGTTVEAERLPNEDRPALWQILEELAAGVPQAEADKLPLDLSEHFDAYRTGKLKWPR